jgi:hypothetical protein
LRDVLLLLLWWPGLCCCSQMLGVVEYKLVRIREVVRKCQGAGAVKAAAREVTSSHCHSSSAFVVLTHPLHTSQRQSWPQRAKTPQPRRHPHTTSRWSRAPPRRPPRRTQALPRRPPLPRRLLQDPRRLLQDPRRSRPRACTCCRSTTRARRTPCARRSRARAGGSSTRSSSRGASACCLAGLPGSPRSTA